MKSRTKSWLDNSPLKRRAGKGEGSFLEGSVSMPEYSLKRADEKKMQRRRKHTEGERGGRRGVEGEKII
jgi:hypothetical protein